MLKMNDIIRKIKVNNRLPYIYMVGVLIVIHCFIKINNCDDVTYATLLTGDSNIFEILYSRYFYWSSRVVIEFFLLYIVKSAIAWKTVNILMYVLLAYAISKLLPDQKEGYKQYIVVSLLLLYPLGEMDSAGWCATSTGYFWTIALGCYGMLAIKRVMEKSRIHWYEYMLYSLAIIYAANHEQMACCLIGIYLCVIIYMLFIHRNPGLLWIQTGIILIEFGFIMLAPGNLARKNLTLVQVRPDYANVSAIKLVYEAYADTMNYFIFHGNILFFLLAVIIAVGVFYTYKNWIIRLVTCTPFVYLILVKLPIHFIPEFLLRRLTEMKLESAVSCRNYISIVISVLILGIMLAGLYLIYENTVSFWESVILLGIGLTSRLAIGTTGSAFGSSFRTIIFFEMEIVVVLMNLILHLADRLNKKWINAALLVLVLITEGRLCYYLIKFNGAIPMNM